MSVNASHGGDGSVAHPFKTIMAAANVALPGDVITVHEGTYREQITPPRGGNSDRERIVYQAAKGEKVVVKGSEMIKGWKKETNGLWKAQIPNSFFGNYNPFKDSVWGDWFADYGWLHHTGDVFLNGHSLYETDKLEKLTQRDNQTDPSLGSPSYKWHCESDEKTVTIWANFLAYDPNQETVEIGVRRTCFYPEKQSINYLTIRGFEFCQAATQWAAPTAEQVGMVSTNWNKGWIIENNCIHDTKANGITLGKEKGTGHNVWLQDPSVDGSISYIEVVFRTLRIGWNRENIGSHIVRNNVIYNCEQTGICGSMGAVFSRIENNHIYNIHQKNQFGGAEIAGIKLHAPVDVQITGNRIHKVGGFGCWFDWMTQGTRISRNLFYDNGWMDVYFEVSHGPYLVDNNIMLSKDGPGGTSEGGAFVHNLVTGKIVSWSDPNRFTPYFLPHSIDVAGLVTTLAGDDRFYNNVFVGSGDTDTLKNKYGLSDYNSKFTLPPWVDAKCYTKPRLPVWANNNVYYNGAIPYALETNKLDRRSYSPGIRLTEEGEHVYLEFTWDENFSALKTQPVTTGLLGKAKVSKEAFENADGSPLTIAVDYFGNKRSAVNPTPGPFENTVKGSKLKVW